MALENKVTYTVYRDQMETLYGRMTDKEWEVFASEIESAFADELLSLSAEIHDNLPYLVEQDSKYDEETE